MSLVFLALSIVATFVCYASRGVFLMAKIAHKDPTLKREIEAQGLFKGALAEENCERYARRYEYAMAFFGALGVAAFVVAVAEASR